MSTTVHICAGPSHVIGAASDDRESRWCFRCRKHLMHTWELLDDPPERQPSYYDPVPICRCSQCGEDHIDFPGTYCDGPRYPSPEVWSALVGSRP